MASLSLSANNNGRYFSSWRGDKQLHTAPMITSVGLLQLRTGGCVLSGSTKKENLAGKDFRD